MYDSDYPEGENMPVFSFSGDYEDYEAYHLVQFTDQEGYVFLTGYYNQRFYTGITVASVLLSALLLIGVVMMEVHKVIRYICILNREIQILESGDLNYVITIKGKNELASMAEGLNSMRQSLREQMSGKEEAMRLNGKIITEMSHELRTPLTALMIYIDILRSNSQWDSEFIMTYIDKIEQKAREIKLLADYIIDYSLEDKSAAIPEQDFEHRETGF
uniref:histidine kinase dimerization/phospho-acceptor domain-containing protein n=1 Tax=Enterocloster aldenensis TaxID=358742 RepID=UPI0022E8E2A4